MLGTRLSELDRAERARFRRGAIGYVAQQPMLAERLTARETIETALAVRGLAPHGAGAALDRVGLDGLADRPLGGLSSGERERVAVARALASGPSLLLADEPTARLDRQNAVAIGRLLRDLAGTGAAVVCATHDPILIELADDVLALDAAQDVRKQQTVTCRFRRGIVTRPSRPLPDDRSVPRRAAHPHRLRAVISRRARPGVTLADVWRPSAPKPTVWAQRARATSRCGCSRTRRSSGGYVAARLESLRSRWRTWQSVTFSLSFRIAASRLGFRAAVAPACRSRSFCTSAASAPWPSGPGTSRSAGRPWKAGVGEEDAEAVADQPLADVRVPVAVRAERGGRVVHVQDAEPVEADAAVHLRYDLVEPGRVGHVVARDPQVARVEADAEPRVPVEPVDEDRELVEGAPDRAARAGGVLEAEPVSSRQRSRTDSSAGTTRSSPASKPDPRCEPTWKTTASAPIAHDASTVSRIVATDFA